MRGEGLRIRLSSIAGVTDKSVLRTPYYFQCPPMDDFARTHSFNHSKYTAMAGEFVRPSGRALTPLSFRTIVVEWGAFVVEFNYDLPALVGSLIEINEAGTPFDLLVAHRYNEEAEIHMDAVLESVTVTETAGEQDARYLDLQFSEYRDPTTKRKGKKKPRRGRSALPFTIRLSKDGTWSSPVKVRAKAPLTLEKIAVSAYGKASWAKHVAKANGIRDWGYRDALVNHPRFKRNGGKIKVPDVQGSVVGIVDERSIVGALN